MATGRQIQKKGPSNTTQTPATGMFKPRPFAMPAEPEAATAPELQTKLEPGQIGGSRLSRIDVSAPPPIQPKLTIGAPDDKYEQEADTIARKVVKQISTPTPPDANGGGDAVQRQMFSKPSIMRLTVQRREVVEGGAASSDLESTISQARSSGMALGKPIRRQMEGAFGADFSGVKVHTNNTADTLNRSLSARAFTTGNNIFFKQGEYNPSSSSGKELLAHELTHVVQQGQASIQCKSLKSAKPKSADWVQPTITTFSSQGVNVQAKTTSLSQLDPKWVSSAKLKVWQTPKTKQIKQLIQEYNYIPLGDNYFEAQKSLLSKIIEVGYSWVKEHDKEAVESSEKTQAILEVIAEAEEELYKVKEQEESDYGNVKPYESIEQKPDQMYQNPNLVISHGEYNEDGSPKIKGYNAGLKNSRDADKMYNTTINSQEFKDTKTVYNFLTEEKSPNLLVKVARDHAVKPAATKFYETVKPAATKFYEAVKQAVTKLYGAVKQLFKGEDSVKEVAPEEVKSVVSGGIFASLTSAYEKFKPTLEKIVPIAELGISILTAYTAFTHMNLFKEGMSESSGEDMEVRDAAKYAYGKLFRKFWTSAVPQVCYSLMNVVGSLTTWLTAGAGATIKLAQKIIKDIDELYRKGKGLWKYFKRTRGVNREKNARIFVEKALKGDDNALTILTKLDLFGFLYKQKKQILSGAKKEEFPDSSPTPENKRKMQILLKTLSASPIQYGYNSIQEFILDVVAPSLKSFV